MMQIRYIFWVIPKKQFYAVNCIKEFEILGLQNTSRFPDPFQQEEKNTIWFFPIDSRNIIK